MAKIEHIAIWVKDLEEMKTFYQTYFGAVSNEKYHNPKKNFTSYFLSFEDGCKLEIMHNPAINEIVTEFSEFLGITHIAFRLDGKNAVDKLTEKLRADGYTIAGEPRTTGDGFYESVVLDPEGNRLELVG